MSKAKFKAKSGEVVSVKSAMMNTVLDVPKTRATMERGTPDHTMEAVVARIDWTAMTPNAIKNGLRVMIESTTNLELRDLSAEADNERGILREHLADLESGCEHQAAAVKCKCKRRRAPATLHALRAASRAACQRDERAARRTGGT